jgi:hypothetical protein
VKKALVLLLLLLADQATAQTPEVPNFSILGQVGESECTGYLGNGNPALGGGLWLGIGLSDRFDGLWGIDYFTMPNQEITVPLTPTLENPATSMLVQATDDLSFTINIRWYWASKYDQFHQRFNTVPYLIVGTGMDMVVDEDPRPPGTNLFGASFDALFALNLGAGIDLPLGDGKQWFLYGEGLDHMIAWQGLTQIYSARVGFKVMLDSAHVDPFRGLF